MPLASLPSGSLKVRAKMITTGLSAVSQMKQCEVPRLGPVTTTEEYGPGLAPTWGPERHVSWAESAQQGPARTPRSTVERTNHFIASISCRDRGRIAAHFFQLTHDVARCRLAPRLLRQLNIALRLSRAAQLGAHDVQA